jgi:tetratricopeptide (TPR) repeat protein
MRQAWREQIILYLERRLPEQLQLVPLLNVVLPLDIPDNELTAQMTGEVRADNTRDLLIGLLQTAAAERPLIIILEDAQWLDSASWTLARLIYRDVQPLLLVLITRPLVEPQPADYWQLVQAEGTELLYLDTLPMAEISQLVCQRLGVSALPVPVAKLIREKAEGHPFFSEELAYALRDAELILIVDGVCRLTPGVDNLDALLPDTIEGVIVSRIDRLPPQTQLTLKVASVIGRIFALRLLTAIYPVESDKLQISDHLVQLEAVDITVLEVSEPDVVYFFRHIITQQVTYNLIAFAQRHRLHHMVAEWYERIHSDELTPFYPLLAYHWRRAEVTEKAITYLEKAGEQAIHNYTNQEAVNFFREALSLTDESGDWLRQAQWLRRLGIAHYRLGDMQESQVCFQEALMLLKEPLPATPRQLRSGLLSNLLGQMGHRLGGGRFMKKAVGSEALRLIEAVEVYRALIPIYFITNESNKFLHATLAALNLAERAGYAEAMPEGYATMGIVAALLRHRWADAYFERAIRVAHALNTPAALGMAYSRRGVYYTTTGRWREGLADYERALESYKLINDQRSMGDCLNFFMREYYRQGNFQKSIAYATELYTMARKNGNRQHEGWGLMFEAMCRLQLGEWEAAAALAENAEMVLAESITDTDILSIKGVLAITYLHQGEEQKGLAMAQEVRDILLASPPVLAGIGHGFGLALEAYLMAWERSLEEEQAEEKIGQFNQSAARLCKALKRFIRFFDPANPDFWYWWGRYYWLNGEQKKAVNMWQEGILMARRKEWLYHEGRIQYQLGLHLPLSDAGRKSHLQRAYDCFEAMKATADLQEARALLDAA